MNASSAPPAPIQRWANQLRRLYWPLLVLLIAAYTWRPLQGGDDFWAHAAVGRWIAQHGQIPRHTLFLWGAPPVSWIAHSWLTQVSFYGLMVAGGPYLVLGVTVALAVLPFALLWRLWTQHAPVSVLTPLLFALAMGVAAPRFHPRPELFTAQFFTALLLFLIAWPMLRPTLWLMAGAAAGFALWANFHGAVALGLLLLGATVVCDLAQERFSPHACRLALLGLLCAGAIFLNPYGAAYFEALKPVSSAMFAVIDEWKPLWKSPRLDWVYPAIEAALVLVALAAWALNPRRRWAHLAWLLLMSLAFVMARRQLWTLALTALAVQAANAGALQNSWLDPQRLWRWLSPHAQADAIAAAAETESHGVAVEPTPLPAGLVLVARAGVVALLGALVAYTTPSDILQRGAVSRLVPEKSAQLILRHPPRHLLNDYESSSYLEWRCAGHPPLFIDLLNAYPETLLTKDYFDLMGATARGRWLLQKRGVDCVVLRRHKPDEVMGGLAKFLNHSPTWQRVYSGADASVWRLKK